MSDPVLHLIAGPNGSGKSTLFGHVVGPVTGLPFVNADMIAEDRWPGDALAHAYEAAAMAAQERERLIATRTSFVTETVFSQTAQQAGYLVTLHVVMVPEELAVARVAARVRLGGHDVPEEKIRSRYERLWDHVSRAIELADESRVYDNARANDPFREARPLTTEELGPPIACGADVAIPCGKSPMGSCRHGSAAKPVYPFEVTFAGGERSAPARSSPNAVTTEELAARKGRARDVADPFLRSWPVSRTGGAER